ncbi:hypothetical protein [Bacillus sp. RO1]|uniref:hypothetical protein n=1 Tax=Bacillus sp. RO1 TaxID=2722703 RepID=UPI001457870B|nr:hypothetical protein [Bacillus sp. RO1]NLP51282.1 hypothetical protein [Bacillus sp. RO1]
MRKDTRLDARRVAIVEDWFKKQLDGAKQEDVAREWGISRKSLSQWSNTNHAKQIHADMMKELSKDSMPTFFQVLDKQVRQGRKDALILYARIHGLYAPTKQEIKTEEIKTDIVKDGVSKEMFADIDALLKGESPTIKRIK